MSKSKKKRNKPYTGSDAATGPTIHHYKAQYKSPRREWWDDHKRPIKIIAGIGGSILIVVWLIFELFRMF